MLLSRRDLMDRYGRSAQQINGWRARSEHPLPEPAQVRDGEPYWSIFSLVLWERRVAADREDGQAGQFSRL